MWPDTVPESWRRAVVQLGAAWLALILIFGRDWLAMAGQWWNSSTYNHILLVPAIIVWLVWQRLPEVLTIPPSACKWGLLPLGLAVLGWVLGSFAGFDLLRQAGAVAMLPSVALLLLGPRAFVALLFPLAYLAFLVPFGDELVPPMQTITAKLVIALVGFSGIPAAINGVFIDTPAGLFEVAEACSGVKFLVAMIALGALVANIGFRSQKRRTAFMTLCILAPILANGIRAWGTIYAAQHIGVEKAAGIDHLIYGWVFFALVMAAVIGLAWRFFDRSRDEPMIAAERITSDSRWNRWEKGSITPAKGLGFSAAMVALGLAWSAAAQSLTAPVPPQLYLPEVPGWTRVNHAPEVPWNPQAKGSDHVLLGSYADSSGHRIDVFYALYGSQGEGREAGGFGQGALTPGSDWSWSRGTGSLAGSKGEVLVYRGTTVRTAHTWYRTGSLLTGSNARLKLGNIADRLLLRARPTAVLILSGEDNAEPAIASFKSAVGDIGPWMDRIAKGS